MAAHKAMLLIIISLVALSTCRSVFTPTPQSWLCPDEGPCTTSASVAPEVGTEQERSGIPAATNPSVPLVDDSQFDLASLFPVPLTPQHTLLDGAQSTAVEQLSVMGIIVSYLNQLLEAHCLWWKTRRRAGVFL